MFIGNKEITVKGRFFRVAKLRHEWCDFLENPLRAVEQIREAPKFADLFTFVEDVYDKKPCYSFHKEATSASVLPVTNYEGWLNGLDFRVRNKIRKAYKNGVEFRDIYLDADLVRGVEAIYNESPIRQGRRFWHYGKSAATINEELSPFLDRSFFVGAYYQNELVGFMKLFRGENTLRTVQIISKLAHRDKAIQDALIARAVQICAEEGVRHLQYGSWSRGSLGAFKVKRGFVKVDHPRYYIPITRRGKLLLRLHLHHGLKDRLPERWIASLTALRTSWNNFRCRVSSFRTSACLPYRT